MEQTRDRLAKVPLFRDMTTQELEQVERIVIPRSYEKRTVVFIEGADKQSVYLIQDGVVKTYKTDENGQEQIVNILGPGNMFPHTGFFTAAPYPATAETMTDAKLLAIPLQQFERLLESSPTIAIKVMRVMGQMIAELQNKLQEFTGQEVQARAQSFLIALADKQGREQGRDVLIEIPITHQEFANAIGTTRESVTRLLSQWKKDGLLEASRSGYIIHDLDQLKEWKPSK